MSYETRYAAMKRQQFEDRANSPEAAWSRILDNACREQAAAELPIPLEGITPEKARAWQDAFNARRKALYETPGLLQALAQAFPRISFKNADAATAWAVTKMKVAQ